MGSAQIGPLRRLRQTLLPPANIKNPATVDSREVILRVSRMAVGMAVISSRP
jgi:hypothetical protein